MTLANDDFGRTKTWANEDLGERLLEHLAQTRHEGELPFSYHLAIQARILSSIEGRDICDVQNDEFLLGETERD